MSSSDDLKEDDKDDDDDDEYEEYAPVVIDNGTGSIKTGFSTLSALKPLATIECVVGKSKIQSLTHSDTYVGKAAILKGRKTLSLLRPLKHGIIEKWDDMQTIWTHIFEKELRIYDYLDEQCIILSEVPLNPRTKREKSIQIMFETYNVASYYSQNSAVLDLYAHGKTTGLVCGAGFGVSYTVPVYQGYSLAHATYKMNIGGNNIDNYLLKLLNTKGYSVNIDHRMEIIEDIKKTQCYISNNYFEEMKNRHTILWKKRNVFKYSLPDGSEIKIGSEQFECCEIYFQPQLIGNKSTKSISQLVYDSTLRCNIDVRNDIIQNIILCGASSLINGFHSRIKYDLQKIIPVSMNKNVNITSSKRRHLSTYLGASILGSLSFFKDAAITAQEYEETGPKIVNRKCF